MKKALFDSKQEQITVTVTDGRTYVQIVDPDTMQKVKRVDPETGKSDGYDYQYDWNEFSGFDGTDFDLEDVKANPSKYMDFEVDPLKPVVGYFPEETAHKLEVATQSNADSITDVQVALADIYEQIMGGAE